MTFPIIMLILLTAPYAVLRLLKTITGRDFGLRDAGAFGLTLLFIMTASDHFADTDSMAQMLPSWVPARGGIIYLTGVLESRHRGGFSLSQVPPLNRLDRGHNARAVLSGQYLRSDSPCASRGARVGPCLSPHSRAPSAYYRSLGLLVHD